MKRSDTQNLFFCSTVPRAAMMATPISLMLDYHGAYRFQPHGHGTAPRHQSSELRQLLSMLLHAGLDNRCVLFGPFNRTIDTFLNRDFGLKTKLRSGFFR